jgi:lipopolysaccharide export system protein LptA
LLVFGFVLFGTAFGTYVFFLGSIDGLPPLPGDYQPPPDPGPIVHPFTPRQSVVDQKLETAFGTDCPELKRLIRLEVRAKGIALATDAVSFEEGRVKLAPFSIALFGKDHGDGAFPEINTVRSDVAYLTFDEPVSSLAEIGNHKIVAGKLDRNSERVQGESGGGITLINNRRSPKRDDDLTLFTPGPIYYQESLHRLWTAEAVHIIDLQNKGPQGPTQIKAIGMDVTLVPEGEPTPAPAAPVPDGKHGKQKSHSTTGIAGVKSVNFRSDVNMHLWVDGHSGFLSSTPKNSSAPAPKEKGSDKTEPVEKSLVNITTQGPFNYDVVTDHARFDISQHPGPSPNNVEVVRFTGKQATGGNQGNACDKLICDHLELQFRHKNESKKSGAASTEAHSDIEVENAHGWGTQITIDSDQDGLTAIGNELWYEAADRRSTLKGVPEMVAMKDGNEIHAPEMVLLGEPDREGRQAWANGAGWMELLNRTTGQRPTRATWTSGLVYGRDGKYEVLNLAGNAEFQDKDHDQRLKADILKVWLEPNDAPAAGATPAQSGNDAQGRRPHHLDAFGHVTAKSPEMFVHDADRLVVRFLDEEVPVRLPATLPAPGAAPASAAPTAGGPAPAAPAAANTPAKGAPASNDPNKPRKPFDLSARFVESDVVRTATTNELKKLRCEGTVRVRQEGETPQDKGVDIRGQTMVLTQAPEGHMLTVTAPLPQLAQVQLDKLIIHGPEVNIDQKENKAWVIGAGFMTMPSNANLQATPGAGPPTPPPPSDHVTELTVHWNERMFFNGSEASYHGNVQAEQDNARLACSEMRAILDHYVSLKEGNKGSQPAKVENLVCDQNVLIEDTTYQDGKRVRYQRNDSREFVYQNDEGIMQASGPGVFRTLQLGNKNEGPTGPTTTPTTAAKPPPPAGSKPTGKPPEQEMQLTRVYYLGRMYANNTKRVAVFYDGVEVIHVPTDDPNLVVDIDKLPQGGMYLRCDQLRVYTQKVDPAPDGKVNQMMEARGKARVQSREFSGVADVIKYDESKELVIFEAADGNLATLYRVKSRGAAPEEIKGKKIYYWRDKGDFKVEGGQGIRAN